MIMPPWQGSGITITGVKTILTAPEGTRLVVVKVETSEPGLYGVGCATFSQRAHAVTSAVQDYLAPLVIGRDPADIEDIWQSCFLSSYWRSGPVLNNALSGIDQALWDIKGKLANVPVYQLFGGKVRKAADVYVHVKGEDAAAVADTITGVIEQGYRYVRAQPMSPGRLDMTQPTWDGRAYTLAVPRMFDYLRSELGSEIELIHDVHERLSPIDAIALAKNLEPYDLYFLEDLFAPEDHEYLRMLRAQSPIAIASGELYVNQQEYVPLVRDRLIDFIRAHVSALGGLTPARKLATLCEFFGIKTAWHGPDDVSPVGHMAQLHLDLSVSNFGIHEAHLFGDRAREVFPGLAQVRDGALWSNDSPGLGIDIDEAAAARYPYEDHPLNGGWPTVRTADGTIVRP